MDAVLPALLAAALAAFGDRPQRLAALLAQRFGKTGTVLFALFCAALINNIIAAAGATLVAPMLNQRAATLLLGLALLFAGASALFPRRSLDTVEGWKLGAFPTSFLALFILLLGDTTAFLTFGFGVWGTLPAGAAIGATVGTMAAVTPAVLLGPDFERIVPVRAIRLVAAALFLITGLWSALLALELI